MKKELVFITARLPYPATSGRKNVMYNYCKILHEAYGYNINIVSFLEEGDKVDNKPDFISNVIVLPKVSTKQKILNLILKTVIQRKWPMQVSLFWDPKSLTKIKSLLGIIMPEIVITDMVRMTEYAKNYPGYKIADLDDMLSIRYKRQLSQDISLINPYGAYLYSLPIFAQKILSSKIIKTFVLKNEIALLKDYERNIAKKYDKTIFVADREANILNRELGCNKAIGVPLGVDVGYFEEYIGKIKKKKNTIAFLGAMSVAHNEAGAIHFIRDILPLIKGQVPEASFIIVGGGITEKLMKEKTDSVKFTGRVKDIRTVVGSCEVFVCSLTFGSGIKTKNLEAMAMGVPVVTTTIGAENINAIDKKDWLIADGNREFADAVVSLLNDETKSLQIAKNAFKFVKKYFTWQVVEERLRNCLPLN